MPLPDTVRVKLSSDESGTISITPVVVRDMPVGELIGLLVGIAGKGAVRIRHLLRGGTSLSGATRFRWTGWDAAIADIEESLAGFPDADPTRPFSAERCVRAVFMAADGRRIEIPREAGARKRLLRRSSFWDALLKLVAGEQARYAGYSYSEEADCYRVEPSPAAAAAVRNSAVMLSYTTLARQLVSAELTSIDLYASRAGQARVLRTAPAAISLQ